jgi:hypothetical protein
VQALQSAQTAARDVVETTEQLPVPEDPGDLSWPALAKGSPAPGLQRGGGRQPRGARPSPPQSLPSPPQVTGQCQLLWPVLLVCTHYPQPGMSLGHVPHHSFPDALDIHEEARALPRLPSRWCGTAAATGARRTAATPTRTDAECQATYEIILVELSPVPDAISEGQENIADCLHPNEGLSVIANHLDASLRGDARDHVEADKVLDYSAAEACAGADAIAWDAPMHEALDTTRTELNTTGASRASALEQISSLEEQLNARDTEDAAFHEDEADEDDVSEPPSPKKRRGCRKGRCRAEASRVAGKWGHPPWSAIGSYLGAGMGFVFAITGTSLDGPSLRTRAGLRCLPSRVALRQQGLQQWGRRRRLLAAGRAPRLRTQHGIDVRMAPSLRSCSWAAGRSRLRTSCLSLCKVRAGVDEFLPLPLLLNDARHAARMPHAVPDTTNAATSRWETLLARAVLHGANGGASPAC